MVPTVVVHYHIETLRKKGLVKLAPGIYQWEGGTGNTTERNGTV
jgi:hypothetical protein